MCIGSLVRCVWVLGFFCLRPTTHPPRGGGGLQSFKDFEQARGQAPRRRQKSQISKNEDKPVRETKAKQLKEEDAEAIV